MSKETYLYGKRGLLTLAYLNDPRRPLLAQVCVRIRAIPYIYICSHTCAMPMYAVTFAGSRMSAAVWQQHAYAYIQHDISPVKAVEAAMDS